MSGQRRSTAERKKERLKALLYLAQQDTDAARLLPSLRCSGRANSAVQLHAALVEASGIQLDVSPDGPDQRRATRRTALAVRRTGRNLVGAVAEHRRGPACRTGNGDSKKKEEFFNVRVRHVYGTSGPRYAAHMDARKGCA